MKNVLAAAAIAATVFAGSAGFAQAAVTTPSVSLLDGSFHGTSPTASNGRGFDFISFTIPFQNSNTVNAAITASQGAISILAFDIFASNKTTILETGTKVTNKYFTLDPITLAVGTYYLGIKSTGGNNGSSSGYSGTLSVSSVPLPNSVALFGLGIAALGVAGAVSRKMAVNVA
ncbi:hypothetical protein P7D22_12850 [Lichenihabitans sp. Uapishka_5]|uniref:hypothetical protein n=1 Tax=Lichenihabitans sp. Uapishka_5 TaxID=3037302 RepID=UPI0029E7E1BF|nr:hypothetical protein [Lichenihabitans sp. Uapishka_5]MDX7952061.1 hypothetical protein [Lichenihabitans sp. Uapishka_5]